MNKIILILFTLLFSNNWENDRVHNQDNHRSNLEDWGEQFYSPYIDVTGWPPLSLTEMYTNTGVKFFNLGFIVAKTSEICEATWGGYYSLDGMSFDSDFVLPLIEDNEIGNIRELGGDVMISIGGASNTPLASATNDIDILKDQYRNIVNTFDLSHLDFDIEGIWILDNESNILRDQALVELQSEWQADGRQVDIWFTLPVLPTGLTMDGYEIVETAANIGVDLSGINIMTQNYGQYHAPNPEGQLGNYAIQASESLHNQLSTIYPDKTNAEIWQMIGIIPMIGINDVHSERFTLSNAEQIKNFVIDSNIKQLSMWSANRDFECEEGYSYNLYNDCSSEIQEDYEFSTIFNMVNELSISINNSINPSIYRLDKAYPNPFNAATRIDFHLLYKSEIDFSILDINGKQVYNMINAFKAAGTHSMEWNAARYGSGIYFIRFNVGDFNQMQKLMLVK